MPEDGRQHLPGAGAHSALPEALPSSGDTPERAVGALPGNLIVDLDHRGVIAVSGADARALLQGQLTNDIEEVDETHTQLSAWCSIKGRVLALFRIWQMGETLHLELPAELREEMSERLRRYVLRSRVCLADASKETRRFGVAGPRVAEVLAARLGPLPEEPDHASRRDGCTLIRLHGSPPRYQVIVPAGDAGALREHCLSCAAPVPLPVWDLLDIRAGIVSVSAVLCDRFLPQMLNLPAINALSFRKGCYAGQEIVARTQYLGRLKRRLWRAALRHDSAPAPGDPLFAARGAGGGRGGEIVGAAPSEHPGHWELLAVIGDEAAAAGDLRLHDADGPRLELLPLPGSAGSEVA